MMVRNRRRMPRTGVAERATAGTLRAHESAISSSDDDHQQENASFLGFRGQQEVQGTNTPNVVQIHTLDTGHVVAFPGVVGNRLPVSLTAFIQQITDICSAHNDHSDIKFINTLRVNIDPSVNALNILNSRYCMSLKTKEELFSYLKNVFPECQENKPLHLLNELGRLERFDSEDHGSFAAHAKKIATVTVEALRDIGFWDSSMM